MAKMWIALAAFAVFSWAQADDVIWPEGAKAAVVLTYDDALQSHLDTVVPQLNAANLLGTFYINAGLDGFTLHKDAWRDVAAAGHELGNHTLYHPCQKSKPDREWVALQYDLDTYTLESMVAEVRATNKLLMEVDERLARTFAYTCGEEEAGGVSFVNAIVPWVSAARSYDELGLNDPHTFNKMKINALDVSGMSGADMIAAVERAKYGGYFVVLLLHGVGAEHLLVETQAHQELVDFLSGNEDYWVTSLQGMIDFLP